jgi:MYXO-CTERM domain-containing protein
MSRSLRLQTLLPITLVASAVAYLVPVVAQACSCPPCTANQFFLGTKPIPSNSPGIYWGGLAQQAADASSLALFKVVDGQEQAVDIDVSTARANLFVLSPRDGFAENSEYVVRSANSCDSNASAIESRFSTSTMAPVPQELGSLVAMPSRRDTVLVAAGGMCYGTLEAAVVDVQWTLPAEHEAWSEVLTYETLVDGQIWSPRFNICPWPKIGSSSNYLGADQVFASCIPKNSDIFEYGVEEGIHTVSMRAYLPGQSTVWESQTVTIDLHCDDSTDQTSETSDPSSTATTTEGSETMNSTTQNTSSGTLPSSDEQDAQDSSGCSLNPSDSLSLWSLAALAGIPFRRRRHS